MAKKQTRRSISVRGTTYNHLRNYCAIRNISMSGFVEKCVAEYFLQHPPALQDRTEDQILPGPAPSPSIEAQPSIPILQSPPLCAEVYETLGLVPLDQFIQRQVEANLERGIDLYRGIGASTWMSVRAALCLVAGQNVHIVAEDSKTAMGLGLTVVEWATKLLNSKEITSYEVIRHPSEVDLKLGCKHNSTLTWGREPSEGHIVARLGDGLGGNSSSIRVFNDFLWKERAVRRARGSLAMLREIQIHYRPEEEPRFLGYAEENEFVTALTRAQAEVLLRSAKPCLKLTIVRWSEDHLIRTEYPEGTSLPNALPYKDPIPVQIVTDPFLC